MARTIADLNEGTMVYVDETVSGTTIHTSYIYLGLDEDGNARLLRQYPVLAKRMNPTNVASYGGCEADMWLENTTDGFLSRFDAETIDALAMTTIKYTDCTLNESGTMQLVQIARRCFLLSYTEEGWANSTAGNEGQSYLPALKAFYLVQHPGETTVTDNQARIGYRQDNGTAVSVWLRSGYSAAQFRFVYTSGYAGYNNASLANVWLRPALSIAPATSVSDEGADAIFLLPEGRRTYWGASATVSLGVTPRRPVRTKLMIDDSTFHTTYFWVCNNYGDAEPTWIPCTNGETVELGKIKTGENWELGVKLDVRGSYAENSIGEPILLTELEEE